MTFGLVASAATVELAAEAAMILPCSRNLYRSHFVFVARNLQDPLFEFSGYLHTAFDGIPVFLRLYEVRSAFHQE